MFLNKKYFLFFFWVVYETPVFDRIHIVFCRSPLKNKQKNWLDINIGKFAIRMNKICFAQWAMSNSLVNSRVAIKTTGLDKTDFDYDFCGRSYFYWTVVAVGSKNVYDEDFEGLAVPDGRIR